MRLLRQQLRGITRFTSAKPVTIDWDALGEGLIAIIGPNGGGKSTLLECAPASLFEVAPCRGKGASLYDIAHGRDAFIETLWEDKGDQLRVLIKIDAEKRKTERQFDINGSRIASSAKGFAIEIEKRFGSKDLFLASVFMAQNRVGAFLQLERAQRKELFAELLLLGRYEELAQLVGIWQMASQQGLDDVRSRLSVLQSDLSSLSSDEAALTALEQQQATTARELDVANLAEGDARDAIARARISQEHLGMLTTTRQACFSTWNAAEQSVAQAARTLADIAARAQERLAAINARRTEDMEPAAQKRHSIATAGLQGRRTRLETLSAQQPAIEKAEAQLPLLADERINLDSRVLEATVLSGKVQEKATEITTTSMRLDEIEGLRRRHGVAISGLDARQTRLEELAAHLPAILEAETALAALARERVDLEAIIVTASALIHRVQSKTVELAGAERRVEDRRKAIEVETARLTRQTKLLSEVPCTAAEEWIAVEGERNAQSLSGACPLLKDARAAGAELVTLKQKSADPSDEVGNLSIELNALKIEAATGAVTADTARGRQTAIALEEPRFKAIVGRRFAAEIATKDLDGIADERQHSEHQVVSDIARITHNTAESLKPIASHLGGIEALFNALHAEGDCALTILLQEHDTLKAEQDRTGSQANADVARLQVLREEITQLEGVLADKARVIDANSELANIDLERLALDEQLEREIVAASEAVQQAESDRRTVERDRTAAIQDANAALAKATEDRNLAKDTFDVADTDLSRAQAQIGDMATLDRQMTETRTARELLEKTGRETDSKLAELRARIDLLHQKQQDQRVIEGEARGAVQEISAWRMLGQALGKDGVQALEIDAAGPEVARIANELLNSCYGPRFSITFETLREKVTKPGEFSEAFDITVYDGGEDRKVQLISGGEQVIIGRAIGLAVAIFNGQKNNVRYLDLFEDESVGALDQRQDAEGMTTAQRYILMLRKARLLGKFYQVRVVMHQPECFQLADVRLLVENGTVSIDRGDQMLAA